MRLAQWPGIRSRTTLRVAAAGLLLVSLVMWAVSSPVGSSPDEDYHLISTWCGHGERDGYCESAGADTSKRVVPAALEFSRCYSFAPATSASCQGSVVAHPTGAMETTDRGNFIGDYPPVFYATMSYLVGGDIVESVLMMRVLNALIFVLMLAATFALAAPALRRALVVGAAVTLVPLGVFIVPSINPSSWAMTSAFTVFLATLTHMLAVGRRRVVLSGGLIAIGVLLGAGARADAAVFASLAIGAALIVSFRPERGRLLRMIYPAVLAVLSGLSFLRAGQSGAVEGADKQVFSFARVLRVLGDVPDLWAGALGHWGLGWLDTNVPNIVYIVMVSAFAAVLIPALRGITRLHTVAVAGVALAAWLVPAYLQYIAGIPVPGGVQPRYILPLLMLLAVVILSRTDSFSLAWSRGQRWLLVLGVSGANAVSLYFNIRRYVTGVDVEAFNLDFAKEWWWGASFPLGAMAVWVIGSVAFAGALAMLTTDLRHDVAPAVVAPADERALARESSGDDTSGTADVPPAESSRADAQSDEVPRGSATPEEASARAGRAVSSEGDAR